MAWRLFVAGAFIGLLAVCSASGQIPPSPPQPVTSNATAGLVQDQAKSENDSRKEHPGRSHDESGADGGSRRDRRFLMERFLMDSIRREGGPLELLPLLRVVEVRRELSLDEQSFTEKLNTYWADAQARAEETRKQSIDKPREEVANLWTAQLREENDRFRTFLKELTTEQQDRLIGLFVQAKNYRAVSNQLVANKLGMDNDQAAKLRKEVESIREDTMRETRDRFRRIFDNGGDRDQFEKLIRENHQKIDARIEKTLSEAQRAQLLSLKGIELPGPPDWLIRAVEFGRPGPPMAPGGGSRSGATSSPPPPTEPSRK